MRSPKISVIIPTYNNQSTIGICLESINRQKYDNIEVIVVDGGSDDFTTDICGRYDVQLVQTELGRAAARVRGGELSSGDYLLHVDSDMELSPSVIKECVKASSQYDALIIPETNIGSTYWTKCTDIEKSISCRMESGNLRFLPKSLYDRVGGHNSELVVKEDEELHDLVKDHGANIGHINTVIKHHVGRETLLSILCQRWAYLQTLPQYHKFARTKHSENGSKKPTSFYSALIREAKYRPNLVPGYLLISLLTAVMVRVQMFWNQTN
ncbi:glycosyltransferase [Halobacteria archaeon HArc-gm2]|nr:glycosyltransferase [Halobacteria archaeon HArc-gm2]